MRILIICVVLLGLCAATAQAQPFSYIYIQGDKQTPFYVKLEGEMQPRYGKNYAILSRLAPGPATIQILFQQNAFPAQEFKVNIPEDSYRSFMLSKRGDVFTLYDAVQHFYVTAGNDISEDHLPPAKINTPVVAVPVNNPVIEPVTKVDTVFKASSDPRFISGLELPAANSIVADTSSSTRQTPPVESNPNRGTLKNSDCPEPMNSDDFSKLYDGVLRNTGDEDRLAAMLDEMDNCFACWQARSLCAALSGDAARFSLLKSIYPRISDQSEFPLLDDLLREEIWKAEFVKLTRR